METYGSLLHEVAARLEQAGIEDARLEAEVLLREAGGLDRSHLLAHLADAPPAGIHDRLAPLLRRRLAREPLAYVTGHREFFGLDLECSPAALVPRPETELLVELALERSRRLRSTPLVLDAGTGNGAIAVAVAVHLPVARVVAVDLSRAALCLARRNAERHRVERRIEFVQCDLLAPFRGRFHLVLANLPYVKEPDWPALAPETREHEPRSALVAGPAGTEVIERLLQQAPRVLGRHAVLLAEIGWDEGQPLQAAAGKLFKDASVRVHRDLAGLDRVLEVELE